MDKRILLFNQHFERWGIALPPDAEQRCPRGTIASRGWTVKYCIGKDQDGKFLDYYAAHRMTNDRHLRIRDNGDVEGLLVGMEQAWIGPMACVIKTGVDVLGPGGAEQVVGSYRRLRQGSIG